MLYKIYRLRWIALKITDKMRKSLFAGLLHLALSSLSIWTGQKKYKMIQKILSVIKKSVIYRVTEKSLTTYFQMQIFRDRII